jgi:Na+/phosphate symporter
MPELQPLAMTINLLGGLALFLYGMKKMTAGLEPSAWKRMNMPAASNCALGTTR